MSYLTAIASLSASSARFVSYLATSNTARSMANCISLARVMASTLPMPSEDVSKDAAIHYRMTHSVPMSVLFDAFNELVSHDRVITLDLVQSFYVYRVNATYMRPTTYGMPESDSALYNFFGLTTAFSPEVLSYISNSKASFSVLTAEYQALYEDLLRKV